MHEGVCVCMQASACARQGAERMALGVAAELEGACRLRCVSAPCELVGLEEDESERVGAGLGAGGLPDRGIASSSGAVRVSAIEGDGGGETTGPPEGGTRMRGASSARGRMSEGSEKSASRIAAASAAVGPAVRGGPNSRGSGSAGAAGGCDGGGVEFAAGFPWEGGDEARGGEMLRRGVRASGGLLGSVRRGGHACIEASAARPASSCAVLAAE